MFLVYRQPQNQRLNRKRRHRVHGARSAPAFVELYMAHRPQEAVGGDVGASHFYRRGNMLFYIFPEATSRCISDETSAAVSDCAVLPTTLRARFFGQPFQARYVEIVLNNKIYFEGTYILHLNIDALYQCINSNKNLFFIIYFTTFPVILLIFFRVVLGSINIILINIFIHQLLGPC